MIRSSSLILTLSLAIPAASAEPEWPQFRGPNASGVAAADAAPPTQFGPGRNVVWSVAVPPGVSSPVIAGDLLFLTAFENGQLFTLAYDRATGKERWRAKAPAKAIEPYHKTEGSPAASSCATDGSIVVSYFGSFGLLAYDRQGQLLWQYELPCAKTGYDFGTGVSPILADGLVILARDLKDDSRLIAVNDKTGSRAWETKRDGFPTAWSTPALWNNAGSKQIVVPGYAKMTGYDLASGKVAWTYSGLPAACCTSPVVFDGMLVFAGWSPGDDMKMPPLEDLLKQFDTDKDGKLSKKEAEKSFLGNFFDNNDPNKDGFITKEEWEEAGKFMARGVNSAFALKPGAAGDLGASAVAWKMMNKKVLPYVPTGVVAGGVLYLIKDGGLLSAYDAKTGKAIYESERVGSAGQYYASLIAVNGHLYLTALNGDVQVVKTGEVPEVVFRGKLGERTAATPAVVGKTLYVRTATKLYAFEAK
jgi:outer membrane protein assembly factor BamB